MRRAIIRNNNSVTSPTCHMEEEGEVRRGPWTLEEDTLLTHYIARHGEGRWNMLAKTAGLKRNGKSCRLRWLNYLKPDIKRGNLTPQEQLLILELHSKWGNRWSKIAQHLPGRTDNEIKNYWRTRVQKQARQLNIESNSQSFLEAVRSFWMPRLVQKMEQAPASSSSVPSVANLDFQSSLPSNSEAHPSHYSINPPSPISTNFTPAVSSNTSDQSSIYFFSDQLQAFNNPTLVSNQCVDGVDVFVNNRSYNSESNIGYDMADRSFLSTMSPMDSYWGSSTDCQMVDAEWTHADMADTLWNMDDMFQFRE